VHSISAARRDVYYWPRRPSKRWLGQNVAGRCPNPGPCHHGKWIHSKGPIRCPGSRKILPLPLASPESSRGQQHPKTMSPALHPWDWARERLQGSRCFSADPSSVWGRALFIGATEDNRHNPVHVCESVRIIGEDAG